PRPRVAAGAPPPTLRRAVGGGAARGTPRPAAREGVRRLGHHHADGARAARHHLLQPRRARARGAGRAAHPGRSAPRRRRPVAAGHGARSRRDLVARAGRAPGAPALRLRLPRPARRHGGGGGRRAAPARRRGLPAFGHARPLDRGRRRRGGPGVHAADRRLRAARRRRRADPGGGVPRRLRGGARRHASPRPGRVPGEPRPRARPGHPLLAAADAPDRGGDRPGERDRTCAGRAVGARRGAHQRRGRRAGDGLQPDDRPPRGGAYRPRAPRRRGDAQHRHPLRDGAHHHLHARDRGRARAGGREDLDRARPGAPARALAPARAGRRGRRLRGGGGRSRRAPRDRRARRPGRPLPGDASDADREGTAAGGACGHAARAAPALPAALFKDDLLGVVLARLAADGPTPDLELAAALASQAAAALANAGLFETVRQKEGELRKLSHLRAQAQEESLRAMSRELHDGFGQVLTVISMDLGMLERAPDLDAGALRAELRDVRDQLSRLMQEVRTMSQVLRPPMLDFGLVPTLHWFVEKFTRSARVEVRLRTPPEETRLPPPIELLLYRVTQEALTNVAKHARARHVEVELAVQDAQATLNVADDGVGFEVDRFRRTPSLAGVGLLGMRERVAYYRGELDIRSRPNAGVRIQVAIPLDAVQSAAGGPAEAAADGEKPRAAAAGPSPAGRPRSAACGRGASWTTL